MDNEDPTSENDHSKKPKRKGRGETTGIKSKKQNRGPKEINLDENGRAFGPWKLDYVRDITKIAHNNIKITYEDWFKVPEGIKDSIWKDIKGEWNFRDDEMRKKILSNVATCWRLFKTNLTTTFIYKTRKQRRAVPLDDPLTLYKGITPDDWKEFVKQRLDENFKEKSRKAQESQKHNVHRHYMGRSGYLGKIDGWYQEELNDALANNPDADPEAIEKEVAERFEDRGYVWIKGHLHPSKEVPEETENLISEIKHWDDLKRKGEFVPSGREDVLVKATGKFDRPGFTRAVGGRVGITSFFGKSNSPGVNKKVYTEDDFKLFMEKMKKDQKEDIQMLVKQQVAEILKCHTESNTTNDNEITKTADTTKTTNVSSSRLLESSSHSTKINDPFHELEGPVPCRLAVYVAESKTVVGAGTVWPWVEGKMVHNTPLSRQNVHVSIDSTKDGKALLPIPWDGNERIGEVIGSFAQWPKSLVLLGMDEDDLAPKDIVNSGKSNPCGGGCSRKEDEADALKSTKKKKGPLNTDELSRLDVHCERLEDMISFSISEKHETFTIDISELVYSYETPITLIIMFTDIREMFRYEWLNISILQLWGSFLYDFGTQRGVTEKLVGFLCPDRLCTYMHSSVEMERYLAHALKNNQDKRYVMGAFFEASHWMLVVFVLRDNVAYIFDSDNATKKTWQIKNNLSWAWKRYSLRAGKRDMSKKKELQIKMIQCPQQPQNYECGYYVMKWMYDITVRYALSEDGLEECVAGSEMAIEQMNEVRELWALYCAKNI